MFRDILSSRGIIIGIVFFIVVVVGTQWYSWHIRRNGQEELARTNQMLQHLENKNKPRITLDESILPDTEALVETQTSEETNGLQATVDGLDAFIDDTESGDVTDVFLPDDMVGTEEKYTEMPVSPFGFGPYPEVPPDYPSAVVWKAANHGNLSAGTLQGIELLDRVLVKLWSEGKRGFKGGIMAGSKVYPHYHNTAYVRYAEEAGYRYISEYQGGPGLPRLTREQLRTGKLPAGIRIIDMDSAGIDAYRFLDLK